MENMPKVLGIGAFAGLFNLFLYRQTLLARNVALEIFTNELA